ncbi:hypothetical protein BST28_18810 [Mycolicibacter kumamotonensis]|uniref:LamG-like jellyroll fold domain-containing protein n=2 Tax=Mycolicibacter kumamotonensis TaxID=354243 RepID=A0A1X0DY46_9MYCO|nr:hypothetical protein BST28_18810 [Mycolicibacter kumamotonensis]
MEDGIEAAAAVADLAAPASRKVNGHDLTTDVMVTKADVGLSNVDNTSDADKPLSDAATTALSEKVTGSVNGTATGLTLWTGTAAQFAAVASKDPSTVYVYPGGVSIGDTPIITTLTNVTNVTVSRTKVSADIPGFPLYVDLSGMPVNFWETVAQGGGDIRCYVGEIELAREVVLCDKTSRTGELHVKVDLSSTADTVITVKVNGSGVDYAPTDPFGRNAVWSDYAAVWHLSETTGAYRDSTGNAIDSTSVSVTSRAGEGKLGGATAVTNYADQVLFGDHLDMGTDDLSVSMWLNTTDTTPGGRVIMRKLDVGVSGWQIQMTSGQLAANITGSASVDAVAPKSKSVNDGVWHLVTVIYDRAGNASIFIDGAVATSALNPLSIAALAGQDISNASDLGLSQLNAKSFIGLLDEIRASRMVLSAARVAAEYANQNNPAGFYAVADAAITSIDGGGA